MEEALVITGLTKLFPNGRGINNINLSINQGEILGILGPNGAGKTTLLRCITGLAKPNSGEVKLYGIHLWKHFKEAIHPVSALIGPASIYENMTPVQNLKMILRFYPDISTTAIDDVLQLAGLSQNKHEKMATFSLGMKQRFGIAAALISKPRLVILDEPTNGLDIDGLLFFRQTIQNAASKSGVTFVISSHHLSELEKLCHRYCFLINGHASLYESTEESLEEIYVKKVQEASNEDHVRQRFK
ncbi:ABC transporter ATP-binding protein [Neobacillus sp. K501]